MSVNQLGSALSRRAVPRHLFPMLIAALFGLTLALNPLTIESADAAVVPAGVGVRAEHVAASEVGVRYTFGGTSPRVGFDCSGLTQYSYARLGVRLPRTAQQQYNATIHTTWRAARPGDLVFFHSGRSVYHVGIYAGNWNMYAAPHTGARVQKERIWSSQITFGRVR
jgi:cell wall-associated NlpC family hydrolase